MSDLQCPATLVCAFAADDPQQAQTLLDALRGRRVAAVFTSDAAQPGRAAGLVAASLGVAVTTCASLREGPAGAEAEVFDRHRAQLEEIADLHRGETVLVLGHHAALARVLPRLARNLTRSWAQDHPLGSAETVELDGDADGWVLRRWGAHGAAD